MSRFSGSRSGEPRRLRPQSIENYLAVHDTCLALFRDHFLIADNLSRDRDEGEMRVAGRLRFVHGLVLDVEIALAVDADHRVRVIDYAFHAALVLDRHRPIFRYNNAHAYPGHPDAHHKHVFDPMQPDALGTIEWIGEEGAPSLGTVLDELFAWWFAPGRLLDLPVS